MAEQRQKAPNGFQEPPRRRSLRRVTASETLSDDARRPLSGPRTANQDCAQRQFIDAEQGSPNSNDANAASDCGVQNSSHMASHPYTNPVIKKEDDGNPDIASQPNVVLDTMDEDGPIECAIKEENDDDSHIASQPNITFDMMDVDGHIEYATKNEDDGSHLAIKDEDNRVSVYGSSIHGPTTCDQKDTEMDTAKPADQTAASLWPNNSNERGEGSSRYLRPSEADLAALASRAVRVARAQRALQKARMDLLMQTRTELKLAERERIHKMLSVVERWAVFCYWNEKVVR